MEEVFNPLVAACYSSDASLVKFLLESGIDVNVISLDLFPLYVACGLNNIEIAKLLLDHGAIVDLKLSCGETALMQTSSKGYTEVVRVLVDGGAEVDLKDKNGLTAMMRACLHGHADTVQFLLDHSAQVDLKDDDTQTTALITASREGYTDVVKVLLIIVHK